MQNFEKKHILSQKGIQPNNNEFIKKIQNLTTETNIKKNLDPQIKFVSPVNFQKNQKNKKNLSLSVKKKLLKGYSKIHELKLVTIGLASSDKIQAWAEKELPNGKIFGEVTNANTFHYRTFKPSKGGLFCERIFGPIKDFECACGKRQKPTALESRKILEHAQTTRYFCPNCDVEYTWSIIRRYQLGYIQLNAPVTHLWYFQTNPSYLSILFDMKKKHLESIIYCTESITIENMWKAAEQNSKLNASPSELYKNWQKFFSIEEKIQKHYIINEKKKKTKKQKKRIFRKKCLIKRLVFQKIDWLDVNTEIFKNDIEKKFFINSKSFSYIESISKKKKFLFLYIQKQKHLFLNLFKNIWKRFLKNIYRNAVYRINLQQCVFQNFYFLKNCSNSNNLSKNFEIPIINKKHEKPQQKLRPYYQKFFQIAQFFYFNFSGSFLSKQVPNSLEEISSLSNILNEKNMFSKKTVSFAYLEILSKKNKKYLNLQNYLILYELNQIKKKNILKSSTSINTLQTEANMLTKIEKFWNSFYFVFESSIFFISQKSKKTKLQSISKKELLFLLNIVPFFYKILCAYFFQGLNFFFFQKKNKLQTKNWNSFNKLSKRISKKSFEKQFSSKNEFFQQYYVSLEYLKYSIVFSKNTKQIQLKYCKNFPIISEKKFFNSIYNLERILVSFKKYYNIEFCCIVQNFVANKIHKNFDSMRFAPKFKNFNFSDFERDAYKFPFLFSLFQQIYEQRVEKQNSSTLAAFAFLLDKEILQSKIENLSDNAEENLQIKKKFENSIFVQKNLIKNDWKFVPCVKLPNSFEQLQLFSIHEKTLFDYFCLLLFLGAQRMNFGFIFSKNCLIDNSVKKQYFNTFFEKICVYEQIKNQTQNMKPQNFTNISLFSLLKIFNLSIQTKNCEILTDLTVFKLQKLLNFSFLFFSLNIFSCIQKNERILKKIEKEFSFSDFICNFSKNIHEFQKNSSNLYSLTKRPDSKKFIRIKFQKPAIERKLSEKKYRIENLNERFDFQKKLFKKMKQGACAKKKKFGAWQIQKVFSSSKISNLYASRINQTKFSIQSQSESKLFSKNYVNSFNTKYSNRNSFFNKNNMKKLNFSYEKEKISTLNFSLFSQKKQNSQSYKNSNLRAVHIKNFVYTIAYNFIWNNDSDWKYFAYYNSFFMHKFEDIPIFEYSSFSKRKNSLFFSTKNFLSKRENSFVSFLSFQIDSFQKNFLIGAGILEKFLTEYNSVELRKMTKQHQILLPKINQTIRLFKQIAKTKKDALKIQKYFQKREHIIRRLKFLRKFFKRNSNPNFMILRNLPVLPPDLRPILKLQNQIAASDLNRFYQRIIYRNNRLKKFSNDSATNQSFEIQYAHRLLQEAVDNLIQNGKGGVKAETNSRGQALKSLSEILKGKQGRFRQYLLGKRVDYSGRSVIVVGPQLKLYECGIPKEMALELFLPFLIQYILKSKLAQTVIGAKNLLKNNSIFTLHLLHKVMKNIPVLLNRAPTLHRLGFQAFLPKLIEGRAILLHPMVCPAFNADFDGDQMAVHIPLTVEARTEAWKFMLASNNLINSATGEPVILPSQDMVLGCYYLTLDYYSKSVADQCLNVLKKQNFNHLATNGNSYFQILGQNTSQNGSLKNFQTKKIQNFQYFIRQQKSFLLYHNLNEILAAYQKKEIHLHTSVWVKWPNSVNFANYCSKPIEIRVRKTGYWELIQPQYTTFYDQKNHKFCQFIRTTTGRILMNLMIQQCMNSNK